MKLKIIVLAGLALSIIVVISGCVNQQIGGERDEHGCLGPAGYTWNESVGACVREWELDEEQKRAAGLAVEFAGYEYATTITKVVPITGFEGSFEVVLEQGENRNLLTVVIDNWTATEKMLKRHTCTEEEKQAEVCTLEYAPVCGFKSDGTSQTYGNACQACADQVEYWEIGECVQ